MKYIILIGLQNNFDKYRMTRHNAGAIVLSEIEAKLTKSISPLNTNFSFFYSPTYMNVSGEVFQKINKDKKLLKYFLSKKSSITKKLNLDSIEYKEIFVFCDDVNLSIGEYRISFAEGASSHNGIKSIVEKLGSKNFYRVRLGVGKKIQDKNGKLINWRPEANEMSNYVLANMKKEEIELLKSCADKVAKEIFSLIDIYLLYSR